MSGWGATCAVQSTARADRRSAFQAVCRHPAEWRAALPAAEQGRLRNVVIRENGTQE